MATIKKVFDSTKLTENGDFSFSSTGNNLLDILFMSEYYTRHPEEVTIGDSSKEKVFAMFMRDPRYGIGKKVLGMKLLDLTQATYDQMVKCGRFDDLWKHFYGTDEFYAAVDYLSKEVSNGNELAKKWMPRFGSKNREIASKIAHYLGLNKQEYGKWVKLDNTVESLMTHHLESRIKFENVPSLAMLKYAKAFATKEHTKDNYARYLAAAAEGKAKINMSVTTPYDIYKNKEKIDADLFFEKLEKILINAIPIVDTSASMVNKFDSFGKALSIGHYIAKCSTFMPNHVISFSSRPKLIELGKENCDCGAKRMSNYRKEINSMYTGDCSNTDFGAVMNLLKEVGKDDMPEYLLVLSDMEFDYGSKQSKDELQAMWKANGYTTKIIWWNLTDGRGKTVPEMDTNGNIYMSGYSPMLLKYLQTGFDGEAFLDKLLYEYSNIIDF